MEVLMEVQATFKSIEVWISQPDGLVKSRYCANQLPQEGPIYGIFHTRIGRRWT
jgi:hypothetical protein